MIYLTKLKPPCCSLCVPGLQYDNPSTSVFIAFTIYF